MKLLLAACLILLFAPIAFAQGDTDACHVYLMDQKVAEEAFDKLIQVKDEAERKS